MSMLVKTFGSAVHGINATTITIEVDVSQGINFYIVGLPDNAVKESQQRIDSALRANGYKMPGRKVVINMAPADIRKEGSAYDLPLAIGILASSEQIFSDKLDKYLMMGELRHCNKITCLFKDIVLTLRHGKYKINIRTQ